MTAERKSPVARSLLLRPLGLVTALAVRFPAPVLAAAVLLAAGSLLVCATRLGMRTNRIDLLDPESPYCRLWNEYAQQFDHKDDVVVVVEGRPRAQLPPVLDAVAAEVTRSDHLYEDVLARVDLAALGAKQLYYLDAAQLDRIEAVLNRLGPVLAGDWSKLGLRQLIAEPQASRRPLVDEAALVDGLIAALRPGTAAPPVWRDLEPPRLVAARAPARRYLLTQDGRFGFVLLHLVAQSQTDVRHAIDRLSAMLARLQRRFPTVHIGLTGLPVMESDEMRSSRTGTLKASLFSVLGVAGLFLAGFGGWRQPLWAVLTLAFGVIWTLGYTTLAVGHLNILSMAFGVILVGLGIDFSIHYLARYQDVRPACATTAQALRTTAEQVGPGIVSGGLTSSLAFFMAGTADFPGIAELGLIVGGGILLCLIATVVVLPALVCLLDHDAAGPAAPALLPIGRLLATGHKAPGTTLLVTLGLTAGVLGGWRELRYDHNLLHLQPQGLTSVDLERRLQAEAGQSLWYALSVADSREVLLRRKAQLLRLPSVERVEEIASLLPDDRQRKGPVIARIHRQLQALPARPPQFPADAPAALRHAVDDWREQVERAGGSADRRHRLAALSRLMAEQPPADVYRRLGAYQQGIVRELLAALQLLAAVSQPAPPALADLPPGLVRRFAGKHGRWLIKVFGHGDIWDMPTLARFVGEVRSVDPRATGNPLQAFEASRQMLRSYLKAGLYALVSVTLILVADFRSLRFALLALLPVGLGMLQMFGLLGLLGVPLNPANMIVLPLILGIGIDDGVHVIHDYRAQRGTFHITDSTATAIVMTSLTSMIGFGSLMIAGHRGLESLGRVLTIGVASCLIMSLGTLTALLVWASRRRGRPGQVVAERRRHGRSDPVRSGPEMRSWSEP